MVKKNTTLEIDVTAEVEQYAAEEPNLNSVHEAVKHAIENGLGPYAMGKRLIIAKLREEGYENLPSHKMAMTMGYASDYSVRVTRLKEDVELPSGETITVNSYVFDPPGGNIAEDPNTPGARIKPTHDLKPARWDSNIALQRVTEYLLKNAVGYVMGRLKIIAAQEGDVLSAWDQFKNIVDAKVQDLTKKA